MSGRCECNTVSSTVACSRAQDLHTNPCTEIVVTHVCVVVVVLLQILMGTVYVFCEQMVQEMMVVYSVGSHRKYRHLVFWHYIFFCGGACACAPIAVALYELLGFADTFYASAVWAVVSGVAFASFFATRFSRTSEGILGSYKAAEAELRCRRSPTYTSQDHGSEAHPSAVPRVVPR